MFQKEYIKKFSQAITIQNPIGFSSDGERLYSEEVSAFAAINPVTEELRNLYGEIKADFVFVILANYSIEIGSKIRWKGQEYSVRVFREIFDFSGKVFAYEVIV